MVHVWVAGKTVWSTSHTCAKSECFRDKGLMYKVLYKFVHKTLYKFICFYHELGLRAAHTKINKKRTILISSKITAPENFLLILCTRWDYLPRKFWFQLVLWWAFPRLVTYNSFATFWFSCPVFFHDHATSTRVVPLHTLWLKRRISA